jgi:hypothetical protein
MTLTISSGWSAGVVERWCDDANGALETKVAEIAAGIIVCGEAAYRQGLVEAVRRAEEERRRLEAERRKRIAEADAKRLTELKRSGELLREAEEIRALIGRVKAAVIAGEHELSNAELDDWETWARGYADMIDPVKSGQIWTHLRGPKLSDE